jgi:ribonuclease D
VLRDDRLIEIAQQRPASSSELTAIEGLSPAFISRYAKAVVDCLHELDEASVAGQASGARRLTPAGRRLVAELLVMVRKRATDANISAGVVVTRREMEQAVAGIADARLFNGWRYDFVGSEISARIAEVDEVVAVERT